MRVPNLLLSVIVFALGALGAPHSIAQTKVKIGVIPIYDTLPMYVGRDEGFFKEEGIDLELIPTPGGPAGIAAMEGGSLDLAYTGVTSIFDVTAQGLKVKIVAPAGTVSRTLDKDGARYLVRADGPIRNISDVKGKKVVTNQLRNVVHVYLVAALDSQGVPPNTYQVLELPYPQMPDALMNSQVDLIYEVEPFTIPLIESGKVRDLGNLTYHIHPNLRIAAFIATERWLDKNTELARRVQRAYAKSADFVMKNVNRHGQWQVKYFRLRPEFQDKISTAVFQDADLGSDFVGSLEKTRNFMIKYGFLKKEVDVKSLIFR